MKQRFLPLLLAALLALSAGCSPRAPEEAREPSASEEAPASDDTDTPEESPAPEDADIPGQSAAGEEASPDGFYPASASYLDYDGAPLRGASAWNPDGTLTFQNENTLTTLSPDNRVLETVELPAGSLPGGPYDLSWSDACILAANSNADGSENFGAVYFTDGGGVYLANISLFDRQGSLVRQYYQGALGTYDESGQYVYLPPCPEGETVTDLYSLTRQNIHWLDSETAVLECHARVVLYDFAADSGRVLDDMSEIVDRHGKFGVYYGAGMGGVMDGAYYYLAFRDEDLSNNGGTVWRADENGAEELFGGHVFWHLFVGRDVLMLADHPDPADPESGSRVYCAAPGDTQPTEIWDGSPAVPFADGEQISFQSLFSSSGTTLYSYDPSSGLLSSYELEGPVQVDALITMERDGSLRYYYTLFEEGETSDWVYDTATDTAAELTDFPVDLRSPLLSPDRSCFVEYDDSSDEPRLRVSPWDF